MKILVVHGPNLNLVGSREPGVYGTQDFSTLCTSVTELGSQLGAEVSHFQSNHEGALIDRIQEARVGGGNSVDGIVINPGGLTHTSVSLRDALLASAVPFIEVHMSNIHAREEFRRHSMLSDIAIGQIAGFGSASYTLAVRAIVDSLTTGRR